MLVPSALSRYVICQRCGRNLTWRLPQHQCPNLIKTRRFGSFAMIVESPQKCNFTLWPRNVHVANLTTPAKQEADRGTKYQYTSWLLCENDPTPNVARVCNSEWEVIGLYKANLAEEMMERSGPNMILLVALLGLSCFRVSSLYFQCSLVVCVVYKPVYVLKTLIISFG